MKKMTGLIAIVVLFTMFSSAYVYAGSVQNVDLSGLTEEQKAQLVVQAEQFKQQKKIISIKKVNEWVVLGQNVALAITSAAKEVGVASDEFLKSTTGKLTVALIIWKIAGRDLVGLLVGVWLLFVMLPVWIYLFRRMCIFESITVKSPEEGFKKIKEYKLYDEGSVDGTRFVMLVVLFILIGTCIAVIF